MNADKEGCGCGATNGKSACAESEAPQHGGETASKDLPRLVDQKVTLLIAAGAAIAANCDPCLHKVVTGLKQAGVAAADIRRAVEIGQFVKDKPAANMKELADQLTGTRLASGKGMSKPCPLEEEMQKVTCG